MISFMAYLRRKRLRSKPNHRRWPRVTAFAQPQKLVALERLTSRFELVTATPNVQTPAMPKRQICRYNPAVGIDMVSTNCQNPQRLRSLDSVRGLAALIVLIHHCLLLQPAFSTYFFSDWQTQATTVTQAILFYTPVRIIWSGYEAVTLFFVLSGVVLALPWIGGRPPHYSEFCIKRICRIYLPYAAIIAIAAIPNALLQPSFHVVGGSDWVNTETWSEPVTAQNLVQHALMIGQTKFRINGAVHSLIWEMRVSLIFPLLILPLLRWRAWGAIGLIVFLLTVTGALQAIIMKHTASPAAFDTAVSFAVWELQRTVYYSVFFVLGAAIALYLREIRNILTITAKYHGGTIVMVIGLLMVQTHWSQVHAVHNLGVAVGSALIIAAALGPGRIETVLAHRWLQFLGRISYSVYLVQVPVLVLSTYLLQNIVPLWAMVIIAPPLVIGVGWVFHQAIADRCADLGRRISQRSSHRSDAPLELVQAQGGTAGRNRG